MPIETVARENNAARPSEALIAKVQADRMRQITGGAIQNYQGAGLRATDLPTVRWMAGARPPAPAPVRRAPARTPVPARPTNLPAVRRGMRGLGDCLISAQSEGMCPDGSEYMGTLDSGGAASGGGGLSFPWFTGTPGPAPTAAPSSSGSSDWAKLAASVLPASFTTLQEAIAQPGQVVKTPTTLITGSGANIANIPGLSTVSSNTGLLMVGAVVVIGGLLIFGGKKR